MKRLYLIFAALYFVQGTGDSSYGFLTQPIRSMLRSWDYDAQSIAAYLFWLGLPWYIKPVFGLLTDFLPIKGLRRKYYFICSNLIVFIGLVAASMLNLRPEISYVLLVFLIFGNAGTAFADVVTDGHMIDKGQPLGITGKLQAVQHIGIYTSYMVAGVFGGYICRNKLQNTGFLICALMALLPMAIAIFLVKDDPVKMPENRFSGAWSEVKSALTTRVVILVAVFFAFLKFSPFSADVYYVHVTKELGFDEQFIGYTYSLEKAASLLACVLYAKFAERVSFKMLLHGSIVFAILSNLVYIGLQGETSAMVISFTFGFVYMVANLTLLELAARYCPPAVAGTLFAFIMSLSNLSWSSSAVLGGYWYESWKASLGASGSYSLVVLISCAFTAFGWLAFKFLPKEIENK